MPVTSMSPATAATAGALCISSSAILMRLAGTAPAMTAFGRCALALPVLGGLAWLERRRGAPPLATRSRWLARIAGLFLAGDLVLWSHAITAIGAGLGTVVTNLQVLIVSLLAWLILGERPRRSLLLASPVMLAGLALVGGLGASHAYGSHPALGLAFGVGVAVLYSIYILLLRQATSGRGTAVVAVLFEATAGAVAGSVLLGLAGRDFGSVTWPALGWPALSWPALGWLALLALTSQVIGWLLITVSMPRLPAAMIGVLLLVQPAGSVALSYVILGEWPSASQLLGVGLVLAGVLVAVSGRSASAQAASPQAAPAEERRSTKVMRQASAASTGKSSSKSP